MERKKNLPSKVVRIKGAHFTVPDKLDIGDSFFVPALNPTLTMVHIDTHYRKRRLYKLTSSQRVEKGILGIRVWRIA